MFEYIRVLRFAAAAAGVVLSAGVGRGDTVTVSAAADCTIYEDGGGLANGSGEYLFAGRNSVTFARRALIRFDLSGIPAGSTINGVTLSLYMNRSSAGDVPFSLHRLTNAWNEGPSNPEGQEGSGVIAQAGDTTWWHRSYDQVHWSTHGGEYAGAASATSTVAIDAGFYEWSGAGMVADVGAWLAAPASNFGWILIAGETGAATAKRFSSRSGGDVSLRPTLVIDYTPAAPQAGACCLPGGVCQVLTAAQCASQGGTFQGAGTSCTPNPCTQPTGACCLPSGVCVTVTAAQCGVQGGTYQGDGIACGGVTCPIVLTPYVDALPLPGVAQPVSGVPGGQAHYAIAMTEFTQRLHRDLPPTRVWGYGGSYPGPTIEARRGLPVTVEWINDLRDAQGNLRTTHALTVDECLHGPDQTGSVPVATVHLHGGHVPSDSDGQPDGAFPPGQMSPVYTYPNNQPAATIWYHDHALGITRLNVQMGLAGFYLIRDAAEDALNIPRGEFEIPLAIQDRSFNPDGSLRYPDMWMEHFFGDFVLVNGKVWPYLNVKQGKYRFRMLNGSNSRAYTLALSDGATFWQIGTDSGLLGAPVALTSLTVLPGERADVVVDFAPYAAGTEIVLTNSANSPFPNGALGPMIPNVMKFVVQGQAGDVDPLPAALVPVVPIPEAEAQQHRDFVLRTVFDPACGHNMWMINGLMWDDITEFPRLGTTEVWSWINRSGVSHPMHMHLVSFQILDRQSFTVQGGQVVPSGPRIPPAANEAGWKDTVNATPFQITRVIARFEDFAGRFPYHCHVLEHEDHEMMRQFEVCAPASFEIEPQDVAACAGATAEIYADVAGSSLVYTWRKDGAPLSNGPTGTGSVISGAAEYSLFIENAGPADAGVYDCVATNQCSTAISRGAVLTVAESCCDADVNCDGVPDQGDVACMILAVAGDYSCFCQADPDFNRDGVPDQGDVAAIIMVVAGAPCP